MYGELVRYTATALPQACGSTTAVNLEGLCNIRLSGHSDKPAWFVLAKTRRPVDGIGINTNGILVVPAPIAVTNAWKNYDPTAIRNHVIPRLVATNSTKQCAWCKTHLTRGAHCKCGLFRYCDKECQKADWKDGPHKTLCQWACSVSMAQFA